MGADSGVVDWGLARRVAGLVHGDGGGVATTEAETRASFATALERVVEYSELEAATLVPQVELIERSEWAATNLAMLRDLAEPLEHRAASEIGLPGPLGGVARRALGAASGAEAGLIVGYSARRVIGQYAVGLSATPEPARMLLVGPNVDGAAAELGVERRRFLLWVAIHEQTHGVQFESVPWLREHLASMVGELIESAGGQLDFKELLSRGRRMLGGDPRKVLGKALRGELMRTLAGPEQVVLLDRLQTAMTVVEGHAEHVMDGAARPEDGLGGLRSSMDARRARRAGVAGMIARALGLGAKLSQYELGKSWADAVAAEHGVDGLNQVWTEPAALPSSAELNEPLAWAQRVLAYTR